MEYLGINVKTVFKMFLKKQAERQGLKHLAQDHYKQQALVSMVITLWVRHSVGNFLTS
jgi:antitoxin component of RelBE/YafQ-DinJ toxin-antitoxin module